MRDLNFSAIILLIIFLISISYIHPVNANTPSVTEVHRGALQIVVGVGIGSSPPASSPEPYPPQSQPPLPPPPPAASPPPPAVPHKPPSTPSVSLESQPPLPPWDPPTSKQLQPPAELQRALRVIRRFKKRITNDPQGITKTWKGNNICIDKTKYVGFICARTKRDNRLKVVGVQFEEYNFNGNPLNLSGFIEDLKDLVVFHVNSNNFTGLVPSKVSRLPYFYELDLSNNKLGGRFPHAVLGATNLTYLDLRFNQLTGRVPPRAFRLDVDVLFLNNNDFTGRLPDNFGSTTALFLTFANNKFTGPIPKSIGQASNTLLEVLFLNNKLSGCLPYEIGLLRKATVFDASKNRLTGRIPQSFGCLARMQQLNLSRNRLFGPVPELLCKLTKLYKLTLNFNYFTQVGPQCRNLINKKVLDVSMNCIRGLPSQRSAKECAAFFSKRRSCPDERSFNYVPCNVTLSTSEGTSDNTPGQSMAPSPSYAALVKPRS